MAAGRARQTHGTRARDVDGGTRSHARLHRAMESSGENIRQQRQVADLLHGLFFVGELDEVEIGVGYQDVFGLSSYPSAHIHIAISRARTSRIDGEADTGLAFPAIAAAPAGDVERHSDQVTD